MKLNDNRFGKLVNDEIKNLEKDNNEEKQKEILLFFLELFAKKLDKKSILEIIKEKQ